MVSKLASCARRVRSGRGHRRLCGSCLVDLAPAVRWRRPSAPWKVRTKKPFMRIRVIIYTLQAMLTAHGSVPKLRGRLPNVQMDLDSAIARFLGPSSSSSPSSLDPGSSSSLSLAQPPPSSPNHARHSRRITRPRKSTHVPPRRAVEEKKHYRQWLGHRDVLLSTGDANDCGCALHEFGCYSFLIATLVAQQMAEKLLNRRLIRFQVNSASSRRQHWLS